MNTTSRNFLITCVLVVDLLAFIVGMMLSWTSPILPKLMVDNDENHLGRPIDSTESSWIGSLLALGGIFGPFTFVFGSEKLGKKWMLLAIALISLIGFVMFAVADSVGIIYAARAICGLVMGGLFTIVPAYITEISEDSIRGVLATSMNIFLTTGMLLTYAIGPYTPMLWFNLVPVILCCIFIGLFPFFIMETPQHLLINGEYSKATTSLKKLRSNHNVQNEIDAMKEIISNSKRGTIKELINNVRNRKAFLISLALIVFQQLSGISAILAYTQNIFDAAKSSITSDISALVIGAVQVIGGIVTPMVVDRYGRKVLLVASLIGITVSEVVLGVYFYLDAPEVVFWLPVLCLVLYILTYGFGFGPLPWTIMAELLPSEVKAVASILSASLGWFFGFLITLFFADISKAIGMYGSFWLFSGFNVLALAFIILYLPETKGKSAMEIQRMLEGR